MNIINDEKFNQSFPLVSKLIEQAIIVLGVNDNKAEIIKYPSSPNGIIINPTNLDMINQAPQLTIKDPAKLEIAIEEYIKVIYETEVLYNKKDYRKGLDYFILRVWLNATNWDFDNPVKLYQRYTNFINDDTFKEYDNNSFLGSLENGSNVYVQRFEEEGFAETPYAICFTFKRGDYIFYSPIIRYGIEDINGEKTAYIYAIQKTLEQPKPSEYNEYQKEMDMLFKQINIGIRENISSSAVNALSIFIGMLHREGIANIKTPDFLFLRWYGEILASELPEEKVDKIQLNLTNKFLTNFLRLKENFENFNIIAFPGDIDSFMYIKTSIPCKVNVSLLEDLYGKSNIHLLGDLYEMGLGQVIKNKCI